MNQNNRICREEAVETKELILIFYLQRFCRHLILLSKTVIQSKLKKSIRTVVTIFGKQETLYTLFTQYSHVKNYLRHSLWMNDTTVIFSHSYSLNLKQRHWYSYKSLTRNHIYTCHWWRVHTRSIYRKLWIVMLRSTNGWRNRADCTVRKTNPDVRQCVARNQHEKLKINHLHKPNGVKSRASLITDKSQFICPSITKIVNTNGLQSKVWRSF